MIKNTYFLVFMFFLFFPSVVYTMESSSTTEMNRKGKKVLGEKKLLPVDPDDIDIPTFLTEINNDIESSTEGKENFQDEKDFDVIQRNGSPYLVPKPVIDSGKIKKQSPEVIVLRFVQINGKHCTVDDSGTEYIKGFWGPYYIRTSNKDGK